MKIKKQKRQHRDARRLLKVGSAKESYLVFVGIVFIFALLMVGVFEKPKVSTMKTDPTYSPGSATCCDSGNGENCKASDTTRIRVGGVDYGLLKSNFLPIEREGHLRAALADDGRIFYYNNRDETGDTGKPGCPADKDWIVDIAPDGTRTCIPIPNEQIIYVCRGDNAPDVCERNIGIGRFDAYYRLDGFPIPDAIKNCHVPTGAPVTTGAPVVVTQAPGVSKTNLQLQTFQLEATQGAMIAGWVSPWCKPAVYLYPEENMPVQVQVAPKGKMTVTIPQYPTGGWKTFAFTDGTVRVDNHSYDYLYYEAEIPDHLIERTDQGYVVSSQELSGKMTEILKQLGLNHKERTQFTEYWIKVLPQAPYYKISVIPQNNLENLAPLTIVPQPQTVLRVALYFEALEKPIIIEEPTLTIVTRKGFTVVEWGGFFKRDPKYPFSCFM